MIFILIIDRFFVSIVLTVTFCPIYSPDWRSTVSGGFADAEYARILFPLHYFNETNLSHVDTV